MLKKRKGSSYYWYKFRFQGRMYEESTKMTNKRAAASVERAARLRVAQEATGTLPATPRESAPLFEAWAAEWIERYRLKAERTGRRNTYLSNRYHSRKLTEFFTGRRLNEITTADVLAYQRARMDTPNVAGGTKGRPVSNQTMNLELGILRNMFKAAIDSKRFVYMDNPASGVKKQATVTRQRRVTAAEVDAHLTALRGISVDAFDIETVMARQGCRNHEVCGLRVQDVDFGLNVIRVANQERGGTVVVHGKTKGSRRELYMHPDVRSALFARAEAAKFARDAFLFPSRYGDDKPTTNFELAHRRALKVSGVAAFTPYDLRHFFATQALEVHKVDIKTVSELLGHSNLATTMRYLHSSEGAKRAAMIAISGGVDAGAGAVPASAPVADTGCLTSAAPVGVDLAA